METGLKMSDKLKLVPNIASYKITTGTLSFCIIASAPNCLIFSLLGIYHGMQ